MCWTYRQVDGALLYPSGGILAHGYSGSPEGKNDPSKQSIAEVGPIPCGKYTIEHPEDTMGHGPFVLPLAPDEHNEMHDRAGFLIHGDSVEHPGAASEGCIIMPRLVREAVWASGDHALQVVSGVDAQPVDISMLES